MERKHMVLSLIPTCTEGHRERKPMQILDISFLVLFSGFLFFVFCCRQHVIDIGYLVGQPLPPLFVTLRPFTCKKQLSNSSIRLAHAQNDIPSHRVFASVLWDCDTFGLVFCHLLLQGLVTIQHPIGCLTASRSGHCTLSCP